MAELRLPSECLATLHFVLDQPGDNVSRMDVDGTKCHHFLSVVWRKVPAQQSDKRVELHNLKMKLFVLILQTNLQRKQTIDLFPV